MVQTWYTDYTDGNVMLSVCETDLKHIEDIIDYKAITTDLLKWAEALKADIEVGAIEYEDGSSYDQDQIDNLNASISNAKSALGLWQ